MNNIHLEKLKKVQLDILEYITQICRKNKLDYFLIGGTLLGAVRHKGYIPWDDDLDIAMPRSDYEKFIKVFTSTDKFIIEDYSDKNYWLPFIKVRNKNTLYIEDSQIYYKGNKGIWVDIFPLDNGSKEKSFIEWFQFKATFALRTSISKKANIIIEKKQNIINEFICKMLSLLPYNFLLYCQKNIMTLNKDNNSKYFINLGSQYGYNKQIHLKNKYYPIKQLEFEGKKYNVPNDYNYLLTKIYGKNYMELPPKDKQITHNPKKIKFEDGEEIIFDENE